MSSCRLRKIVETDGGQTITITRATAEAALAEVSLLRTRVAELKAKLAAAHQRGAESMRERAARHCEREARRHGEAAENPTWSEGLRKRERGAQEGYSFAADEIRALPLDDDAREDAQGGE